MKLSMTLWELGILALVSAGIGAGIHSGYVKNGGLLMRKLPDDVSSRLIQLGLIEQKLGGLVITAKGQIAAAK